MKTTSFIPTASLFVACILSSCVKLEHKLTTMEVVDPVRYYDPILFGQSLEVVYTIENTGKEPLFIKDIHVSGGCELASKVKILPVGGKGFLHIVYDSQKNIGYVKNYITIYANFKTGDQEELSFELNVVPNSFYNKDYEEVYIEKNHSFIQELVDGAENERRYSVNK